MIKTELEKEIEAIEDAIIVLKKSGDYVALFYAEQDLEYYKSQL